MNYYLLRKNREKVFRAHEKIYLGFFLFLISVGLNAQVVLRSVEPTEVINVGYNSREFKVIVENTGSDPVSDLVFKIDQPEGMVILPSSVSVLNNGSAISSFNFSNDEISVSESLAPGEEMVCSYLAEANCRIIPDNHEAEEPISNINNITLTYNGGASISKESNSYNVKYADIMVKTPGTPNNSMNVLWNSEYTREIPVKNGNGAGIIDSLSFTVKYNDASVTLLKSLKIYALGGNPDNAVELYSGTENIGEKNVLITPAILSSIGLGDGLDGNEEFIIIEEFKVTRNTTTHTTNYIVEWGTNGNVCNPGQINAMGTLYLNQDQGAANARTSVSKTTNTANACDRQGEVTVKYANGGSSILNTALDLNMYIGVKGGLVINNMSVNGVNLEFHKSGSNYFIDPIDNNIDGDGGIEDIDGDGNYDDLPYGESIEILVEYTYPASSALSPPLDVRIQPYLNYYSVTGAFGYHNSLLRDYQTAFSSLVNGPNDMLNHAEEFIFKAITPQSSRFDLRKSYDNAEYRLKCILPEGMELNSENPVTVAGNSFAPTITGNEIWFNGIGASDSVSVWLDYLCDQTGGSKTIIWELYYHIMPCDELILMETNSWTTTTHAYACGPNPFPGFGDACFSAGYYPEFELKRTTLGYDPSSVSGMISYSDLSSLPKVSEEDNIELNKALVKDSVLLSLADTISLADCDPEFIIAKFWFNSGTDIFNVSDISFNMGENEYEVPLTALIVTSGANTQYEVKIPIGLIGDLVPGKISTTLKMEIREDATTSQLNLSTFRGSYVFSFPDKTFETDNFGGNLTVIKPKKLTNVYFNTSLSGCSFSKYFDVRCNQNFSFANEYRPLSHISQAIEIEIPEGFQFGGTGSVRYNSTDISGLSLNESGGKIFIDADFPIMVNSDVIRIYYSLTPDCNTKSNVSAPIKIAQSNYDYSSPVESESSFNQKYSFRAPNISLNTETNQPGYKTSVTWVAYLTTGGFAANNAWLTLRKDPFNTANITIKKVMVEGVELSKTMLADRILVNVGGIPRYGKKKIEVEATYRGCQKDAVDTIWLEAGWSCGEVSSMNEAACVQSNDYFTLSNKTANMQDKVYPEEPGKYYDLCDSIGYNVDINSTALAEISNLGFWFDVLPENIEVIGDKLNYEYEHEDYGLLTGEIEGISNIDPDDRNERNLSEKILPSDDDGFKGNGDTVELGFKVRLLCLDNTIKLDNPLKFSVRSTTNCQDPIEIKHSYILPIAGFENADSVKINLSGADFTERHGNAKLDVRVENISSSFIDSIYIEAEIPSYLSFVAGSVTGGISIEPEVQDFAETKLLVWELPPGSFMQAKDVLDFSFEVKDESTCPPDSAQIKIRSYMLRLKSGDCGTCMVEKTTDSDTSFVKLMPVSKPDEPIGSAEICEGDTTVYYTNSIEEAVSYKWGVIPDSAATVTAIDTSAEFSFIKGFSGIATVYVVGENTECPGDTSYTEVLVNSLPEVSLTDLESAGLSTGEIELIGGTPAGGTYSGDGVTTSPNFNTETAGPGSHEIVYTFTDENGCSASDTNTITVSCDPIISLNTAKSCYGDTVVVAVSTSEILESCGLNSYIMNVSYNTEYLQYETYSLVNTLSPDAYIYDGTPEDGIVKLVAYAPYKYNGEGDLVYLKFTAIKEGTSTMDFASVSFNGDTLDNTEGTEVTVIPLPTVNIEDHETCAGNCFTFVTEPEAFDAYEWSNGSTASTLKACESGTYSVTVTDTVGCMASDSAKLTIASLPEISIEDTEVCNNNQLVIPVLMGEVPSICNIHDFILNVGYDTSALEYVGFKKEGTLLENGFLYDGTPGDTSVNIVAYTPDTLNQAGTLLYLLFDAKQAGDYPIDIIKFSVGTTVNDSIKGGVVTINSIPDASAGDDKEICEGETVELKGSGGSSYSWSNGATGESITVKPSTTTIYTVTVTSGAGCSSTDDVTVTVYDNPVANAGSDTAICYGLSTELNATGGSTYKWNTGEEGSSITVTPQLQTVYTVTVSNENGCTDTDQVTVNVHQLPDADAGDSVSVCYGTPATLNASGGSEYVWNNGETSSEITVNPEETGIYYVTVSSAEGCTAIDSVVVTVNSLPNASAGENDSVCYGDETQLTATGGTSYSWSTGDETDIITVSPEATTTYFVTVSDDNSCTAVDTVSVTVNSLPLADAGKDTSVCFGSSINLTANGGVAYIWSTGEQTAQITVSPATESTYYVTVSSFEGCTASDTLSVVVNSLPVAVASDDEEICEGDEVTLSANGGISYLWSNGETGSVISLSPTQTNTYTVTVSDENSCTDTDTTRITVKDLPELDLNDTAICSGEHVLFQVGMFEQITWSNGVENMEGISVTEAGTYAVTVTAANQCSNSDSAVLTVYDRPEFTVNDDSLFYNELYDDDEAFLDAGSGFASYEWSTGETTESITVNQGGDYYITVSSAEGCESVDTSTVKMVYFLFGDLSGDGVLESDDLKLIVQLAMSWLEVDSAELGDNYMVAGDVAAECGVFDENDVNAIGDYIADPEENPLPLDCIGGLKASSDEELYDVSGTIEYVDSMLVISKYGAGFASIMVNTFDLNSEATYIKFKDPIDLNGGSGMFSFDPDPDSIGVLWMRPFGKDHEFADGPIIGIPIEETDATEITVYFDVNDNNYDSKVYAETVSLKNTTGILTVSNPNVRLFPNPASDYVTISSNVLIKRVVISNSIGQSVSDEEVKGMSEIDVQINHLSPGLYSVTVFTENGDILTERLEIE